MFGYNTADSNKNLLKCLYSADLQTFLKSERFLRRSLLIQFISLKKKNTSRHQIYQLIWLHTQEALRNQCLLFKLIPLNQFKSFLSSFFLLLLECSAFYSSDLHIKRILSIQSKRKSDYRFRIQLHLFGIFPLLKH